MDQFLNTVGHLIVQYPAWTHLIIGVATLIQGELAILFSMLLITNGKLPWSELLVVAPLSLIIGETFIYMIGRSLRNTRFGWKLYRTKMKQSRRFQAYFFYLKKNLTRLLVIAKFLIGVNIFVILLSGWSRTKFSEFMKSYLTAVIMWFTTMVILAYFFASGLTFLKTGNIVKQAEYGILIVIAFVIALEFGLKRFLKKHFTIADKDIESTNKILEDDREDAE